MKLFTLCFILLFTCSGAKAGFITATDPLGQTEAFASLRAATGTSSNEVSRTPISIPNIGTWSASREWVSDGSAHVTETYNYGPSAFVIGQTQFDMNGRAGVTTRGTLFFSVTESMQAAMTGFLDVHQSSGGNNDYVLSAGLVDMTAPAILFSSYQSHFGSTGKLELGGLQGNRDSDFKGNLLNTLQVGHIYRLMYEASAGDFASGGGETFATGEFALRAIPATIPEPSILLLMALSFAFLAYQKRKVGS